LALFASSGLTSKQRAIERQHPLARGSALAAGGNFLPRSGGAGSHFIHNSRNCASNGRLSVQKRFGTALALCIRQGALTRMFDNLFGIHEQALLLHGQRIGVLATNLANADTPNYKARDIDFSEVLAHTGEASLPMRVTQAAHITISDGELPAGDLKYRNPYQASLDGNTVEMPVEQAAFSENNVRYQASLTFINLKISEMQLAIAGQ
jgi:flagellar basal-body rod protein FlgB